MTQVDVRALAKLARLAVTDAELEKLEKELPSILDFVETIQNAAVSKDATKPGLHNVLRDDAHPHESGVHTDALLRVAPAVKNGRIAVKQVVSRKQK